MTTEEKVVEKGPQRHERIAAEGHEVYPPTEWIAKSHKSKRKRAFPRKILKAPTPSTFIVFNFTKGEPSTREHGTWALADEAAEMLAIENPDEIFGVLEVLSLHNIRRPDGKRGTYDAIEHKAAVYREYTLHAAKGKAPL